MLFAPPPIYCLAIYITQANNTVEPQKHAEWNKLLTDAKDHKLYDSIYMACLKRQTEKDDVVA